nr:RNA-directed DNA polymerase, eukaryota, reverse transcriptase zinc-binding domain protein [Tanacetum cinerariifolium]
MRRCGIAKVGDGGGGVIGSLRSKEDEVQRISMSMFVTNFPEQSCAKDMECLQAIWRLVSNLRTIWIGRHRIHADVARFQRATLYNSRHGMLASNMGMRHRIHADVARFQRATLYNSSKQFSHNEEKRNIINKDKIDIGSKDNSYSYAHAIKGRSQVNREVDSNLALILDESCMNQQDYSCCLNGKVNDFGSLSNLKVVSGNEGFDNIELRYLGGLWVMIEFTSVEESYMGRDEGIPLKVWSKNTFKRISSKWEALLNVDDSKEGCLHRKRLCIYMTDMSNIFESFKLIYQGKTYWVRAKEVLGWILDFVEQNDEDNESNDEHFEGDFKEDFIIKNKTKSNQKTHLTFIIFLTRKKEITINEITIKEITIKIHTNDSLKYPPGFTPSEDVEADFQKSNQGRTVVRENGEERKVSDDLNSGSKNNWSMKDGMESVVSGHFKKAESPRTCGSILLLMDELIKVGQTMGDFNKARNKNERFGLMFNVQGANAFNSFISSAGLEEVPLGAITLDRYLSDHRPILLRKSAYDYGPTSFPFFHYLFEVDGFEKLVNEAWYEAPVDASNAMLNLMNKLKYLKKKIRAWNGTRKNSKNSKHMLKTELAYLDVLIDKRDASDDIISKRTKVVKSIQELDKLQSKKAAQKAKIKWAIEGDENSKYYHGILNKKETNFPFEVFWLLEIGLKIQSW